jgi:phospholipase C
MPVPVPRRAIAIGGVIGPLVVAGGVVAASAGGQPGGPAAPQTATARLDRSQALTCDQNHSYTAEQQAFDMGLMDKFVQSTAGGSCTDKSTVMDHYDGNTVTGLWNYAQHFAMSDNSFSSTFGPSTPGALNLISGQTHGAITGAGTPDRQRHHLRRRRPDV